MHDDEAETNGHLEEQNELTAYPVRTVKYHHISRLFDQRGNDCPKTDTPRRANEYNTNVEEH